MVATPLGNLGDISPRAVETLRRAGLVLAEDTRRAGLLLQRLGISGKRMLSLFEHNECGRVEEVLRTMSAGEDAALISDAGTPLLSDPGYVLVNACREKGFRVSPVPGPSAVTAAVMACGLPPLPMTFLGFLPRKRGDRKEVLERFGDTGATLVFFERKSRIAQSLADAGEALGPRRYCVAREMTKTHENFHFGRLGQTVPEMGELLGEMTVVIAPEEEVLPTPRSDVVAMLARGVEERRGARSIVDEVRSRTVGWTKKRLYSELVSFTSGGSTGSGTCGEGEQ